MIYAHSQMQLFTNASVYCSFDFFNYRIPKIQLQSVVYISSNSIVNKKEPINNVLSLAELNQVLYRRRCKLIKVGELTGGEKKRSHLIVRQPEERAIYLL